MGNGVWTVEIIPAEIQPPARSVAGASGNRIRIGAQARHQRRRRGRPRGRVQRAGAARPRRRGRAEARLHHPAREHVGASTPTRRSPRPVRRDTSTGWSPTATGCTKCRWSSECRTLVADPRKGKNMFALGMLCNLYSLDMKLARDQIALTFGKKDEKVVKSNVALLEAGYAWAEDNLDFKYRDAGRTRDRAADRDQRQHGARARRARVGHGHLRDVPDHAGDLGVALPERRLREASAASCTRRRTRSRPARSRSAPRTPARWRSRSPRARATRSSRRPSASRSWREIPLVVVNVQRGGPSTGQPTKVEQGDLLTAIFGSHGDAPKVVMAPSTIEDCFYSMITARRDRRDVQHGRGRALRREPGDCAAAVPAAEFNEAWLAPPIDQSPVPEGAKPYDWDPVTGLARRFIPGQPGGMHTLTGLAHDRRQPRRLRRRDQPAGPARAQPEARGAAEDAEAADGVRRPGRATCWSSAGAAPRARSRRPSSGCAREGHKVSSLHLRFLQPMPPGIKEILQRFKQVMTVESNWSDDPRRPMIDETNRRYSALAMLLRARYLVDVDCWSEVAGQPIKPGTIYAESVRATGRREELRLMSTATRSCLLAPVRGAPRARGLPGRRAALVHGLRRQRDPRGRAAALPRRGTEAREDGVRVRHRLLEPPAALHEAPTASTASTAARCRSPRASRWRGPTCTCS